jgi:hypothetical protein
MTGDPRRQVSFGNYNVSVMVRTTCEAVMLTLVSSFCLVIAHANAAFGFLKGPRAALPVEEAVSSLGRSVQLTIKIESSCGPKLIDHN